MFTLKLGDMHSINSKVTPSFLLVCVAIYFTIHEIRQILAIPGV